MCAWLLSTKLGALSVCPRPWPFSPFLKSQIGEGSCDTSVRSSGEPPVQLVLGTWGLGWEGSGEVILSPGQRWYWGLLRGI